MENKIILETAIEVWNNSILNYTGDLRITYQREVKDDRFKIAVFKMSDENFVILKEEFLRTSPFPDNDIWEELYKRALNSLFLLGLSKAYELKHNELELWRSTRQ